MGISAGNIASAMPPREGDAQRKIRDLARSQREQAVALVAAQTQIGSGGLLVNNGGSITIEGTGALNVGSGALNSAGSISAGTTIDAGGNITGGGLISNGGITAVGGIGASGGISAASVTTTGGLSAGGAVSGASGSFSSSLSSPGAYTTDVSALPGARQTVWQHNSGVYGFAPSTIEAKTNIGPVPFTAADVRAVQPHVFQYKSQLAIRDDPENTFYDPAYVAAWEIGLMAEELIAHNMSMFVFFEEDEVTPKGINYDLFGAIAPLVVLADLNERLERAGL
jgi:hypothetical protein